MTSHRSCAGSVAARPWAAALTFFVICCLVDLCVICCSKLFVVLCVCSISVGDLPHSLAQRGLRGVEALVLREVGGAPRNPAHRNHLFCTDGHLVSRVCSSRIDKYRRVPTPLRSTSPLSEVPRNAHGEVAGPERRDELLLLFVSYCLNA